MFHVDRARVRESFDRQVRRDAVAPPDGRVERSGRLTRTVALDGSWSSVVWSDLAEDDADEVVAAELRRDEEHLEWKSYTGDRPDDLHERLDAAGWVAGPPEVVVVADLHALDLPDSAPPGVELRSVDGEAGIGAYVQAARDAFGQDVHPGTAPALRVSLCLRPRPVEGVVAWAGDRPVGSARIEFSAGSDFAGLFGGGVVPDRRGQGVFRALVAWRAARARARGVRYLYVDAQPTSRPVLERLGFAPIATTTPWTRPR